MWANKLQHIASVQQMNKYKEILPVAQIFMHDLVHNI